MLNQPQPPPRPTFWEWITASEESRCAYDHEVVKYLTAIAPDGWIQMLMDMAMFYQTYAWEGHQDPNWKRGGYGC